MTQTIVIIIIDIIVMNFTKYDNEIDDRLSFFSLLLPQRARSCFCLSEMFNLMHLYTYVCVHVYVCECFYYAKVGLMC
jgi:hypothetical protein